MFIYIYEKSQFRSPLWSLEGNLINPAFICHSCLSFPTFCILYTFIILFLLSFFSRIYILFHVMKGEPNYFLIVGKSMENLRRRNLIFCLKKSEHNYNNMTSQKSKFTNMFWFPIHTLWLRFNILSLWLYTMKGLEFKFWISKDPDINTFFFITWI